MDILLTAATFNELKPTLSHFGMNEQKAEFKAGEHYVKCLITGVGMVATAFELGKHLSSNNYDMAINAGIAGSFVFDMAIGQVLHVNHDIFADFGAEDGDNFLSIDELGFGASGVSPIHPAHAENKLKNIQKATAITVNRVHGNEMNIAQTITRLKPQLESMEGAAFFYACNRFNLPSIQIRAVSNYVERRDTEKWNIELAVKNLNEVLSDFLNDLK